MQPDSEKTMLRDGGDGIQNAKLFCVLAAVMLLGSVIGRFLLPMHWDPSTHISVWENVLDGMVYGVDVLEVSPPGTTAIYLPGILLGRFAGISCEAGVYITCYALCLLTLVLMVRSDRRANLLSARERFYCYLTYLFVTVVFYQDVFGQREYVAVLLMLPYLVVESANLCSGNRDRPPESRLEKVLIGVMMGVGTAIKPHFLLVFIAVSLFGVYRTRNAGHIVRLETLVFCAAWGVYNGLFLLLFPEYYAFVAEFLIDAYVSTGMDWRVVVFSSHSFFYLLVLVICGAGAKKAGWFVRPLPAVLFVASAAFYVVYFLQRKGFPYQIYPAQLLLFLCAAAGFGTFMDDRAEHSSGLKDALQLNLAMLGLFAVVVTEGAATLRVVSVDRQLEEAVRSVMEKPTLLQLGQDVTEAQPMIRNIGGRYVGSFSHFVSFWYVLPEDVPAVLKGDFKDMPEEKRRYFEQEAVNSRFLFKIAERDIRERRPDIILIPAWEGWKHFLFAQENLKNALEDYVHAKTSGKPPIRRCRKKMWTAGGDGNGCRVGRFPLKAEVRVRFAKSPGQSGSGTLNMKPHTRYRYPPLSLVCSGGSRRPPPSEGVKTVVTGN
ncbi:MAG: hypothetical protein LBR29_07185 [Methylobacteriaceae bacterium]|jgi:hypothetical protein|nr:hypothetical protein [Methylobacteriaceae bacterium]